VSILNACSMLKLQYLGQLIAASSPASVVLISQPFCSNTSTASILVSTIQQGPSVVRYASPLLAGFAWYYAVNLRALFTEQLTVNA
jgi:hypothetical protein